MHTTKLKPQEIFFKKFSDAWPFLYENLNSLELETLMELCYRAGLQDQVIKELNGHTIQEEVSSHLNLTPRKSKLIFDKLFRLGVFGKFRVAKVNDPNSNAWIMNPYLGFLGENKKSGIAKLFKGTVVTIQYEKTYKARIALRDN